MSYNSEITGNFALQTFGIFFISTASSAFNLWILLELNLSFTIKQDLFQEISLIARFGSILSSKSWISISIFVKIGDF